MLQRDKNVSFKISRTANIPQKKTKLTRAKAGFFVLLRGKSRLGNGGGGSASERDRVAEERWKKRNEKKITIADVSVDPPNLPTRFITSTIAARLLRQCFAVVYNDGTHR